jgi:hypothetical protein
MNSIKDFKFNNNEWWQVSTDEKTWLPMPDQKEKPSKCLHMSCPDCHGTGRKANGSLCVHMISCPCPRCTPYHL